MPELKDDASTDIETKVQSFCLAINAAIATLREARLKADPKAKVPVITFAISSNKSSASRTPAEQAHEVVFNNSQVCWGGHMSDKARHVVQRVDGKPDFESKGKTYGSDFAAFKASWLEVMKRFGLKNYKGQDGWGVGDEFHLELDGAKIPRAHEKARACLDEYARLTRDLGNPPNGEFERKNVALLAPHLAKYSHRSPQPSPTSGGRLIWNKGLRP